MDNDVGARLPSQPTSSDFPDDDSDDYMDDEEFAVWMTNQHQEEIERMPSTARPSVTSVPNTSKTLNEYIYEDVRMSLNSYVELQDGDFMKVLYIERTPLSEVTIRGCVYRRTRELNGLLNHKLNEVCWVLHVANDDPPDPSIQGVETRGVSEVMRRRHIRVTNLAFPALSFRDDTKETEETITNYRTLVCRYKYVYCYPDSQARSKYAWNEKGLHRIRASECDKRIDNMTADEVLRFEWRGNTEVGGEQAGWSTGEREFLRQEAMSNQGKKIRQSLKGPNGLEFAMGDPMKRYTVAAIVKKSDLRESPFDSDDLAELASPPTHLTEQQQRPRSRHPQQSPYTKASQTVRIDAQIRTSSDSGTTQAHYKSKITSSFVARPKRRFADLSLHHPSRPVKRSCSGTEDVPDLSQRPSNDREDGDTWDFSRIEDPEERKTGNSRLPSSSTTEVLGAVKPSPYLHRSEPSPNRDFQDGHSLEEDDIIDLTLPHARAGSHFLNESQLSKLAIRAVSANLHRATRTMQSVPGSSGSRPSVPRVKSSTSPSPSPRSQLKQERFVSQTPKSDQDTHVKSELTNNSGKKHRRYTFGDCFCGAGGMSRGAINAGLCIKWGFDFNETACQTYAMNFFGAKVYQVWANEFAASKGNFKCDICHLSLPCQFFSSAHTRQGKDDDMNTASLFSVFNLLEKVKPRVVTLEETAGLIRRHPLFFNAVINMFTSRGFSVRWKVMNCADFGLPQRRLRLFIIASCPGEILPPFPKPTHSRFPTQTGLKPWTTINDAIAKIPAGWYKHDPQLSKPRTAAPTSGDTIAACITTSGGPGNIHPSGKRDFTHREYACLQSFPLGHKFGGVQVKKQIGNAVPPVVAMKVLEEVRRSLEVTDGVA